MSRIGDNIRKIRTAKGLTTKQLGKSLGVSEKHIEEIESGKRVMNDDLLKRISKALGEEINDVMIYYENEGDLDEGQGMEGKNGPGSRSGISGRSGTGPAGGGTTGAGAGKKAGNSAGAQAGEIQDVWDNAFGSVLKTVPVYAYDLSTVLGTRQLPVVSNKVEGYARDKVIFLQIQDQDMLGYRMARGDTAFACLTHEVENSAICLVEYNGQRMVRQIKKLDGSKVLLVSNGGNVVTETASIGDVKVLARLIRLEIRL